MSNGFKAGDVVVALKNSPMGNYAAGDMGTVIGAAPDDPKVRIASWEGWPMRGYVRKATPLEEANHKYTQATAKLEKAEQVYEAAEQEVEQAVDARTEAWAALEAAKKAEEEAHLIKPEDIKGGAMFTYSGSDRVVGGVKGVGYVILCCPHLECAAGMKWETAKEVAEYMNAVGYVKTNKTLKDILTNV